MMKQYLIDIVILVFFCTVLSAEETEQTKKGHSPFQGARAAVAAVNDKLPFEIHGFGESALGWLPSKNRLIRNHSFNLMEGRVQLKTLYYPERPGILSDWGTAAAVKFDLVGDGIDEKFRVRFRDLNVRFSPIGWMDVKAGRQILTWGTGDLLFLNDLFPKDWVSFFIGRDDEYLKRPSDAVKVSTFSKWANANFVLIPVFTPDNPVRGDYLSFYDPLQGRIVGTDNNLHFNRPPQTPNTMEYAARLYRLVGSYELALYGFKGFYKQALGVEDPLTGDLFYPRLISTGTSARGPVPRLGGIGNIEWSWYHSEDDGDGTDPFVENSQMRYLAGYERDLWPDFTFGFQYFVEQMLRHDRYKRSLPDEADFTDKRFTQTLTFRLTQQLFQQTATASLFTFFSPTDLDFNIRPRFSWNITDHWNATVGANFFAGAHSYTMFGQFRDNNAVYSRLRYSF